MRIAQISKADSLEGGASRVASDLTLALRQAGHDTHHWSARAKGGFDGKFHRPLYGSVTRLLHRVTKRLGFPEFIPWEWVPMLGKRDMWDADVVHFHDLSSAISPWTVWAVSHFRPVVWTLHDCSPFTGGCISPMDCTRFRIGCGQCPQIGRWPIEIHADFTHYAWHIKRVIHRTRRVQLVAPSQWMADLAGSSGLLDTPVTVLANGIDTSVFIPKDKQATRERLGLPRNRKIILIAAGDLSDERKGMRESLEALRRYADPHLTLLVVGNRVDPKTPLFEGLDVRPLGFITHNADLADIYAAADAYVFCSFADNQPLSVLETMACGTPTIGFATGGIPEIVAHQQSGWLSPTGSIDGIVQGLHTAFAGDTLAHWRDVGIRRAQAHHSFPAMANRYHTLYQSLSPQQ